MWTCGNVEDWDVKCIITNLKVLEPCNVMFTPSRWSRLAVLRPVFIL